MFELEEALRQVEQLERESHERVEELAKKAESIRKEILVWDQQKREARDAARALRNLLGLTAEEKIQL